MIISPIQLPRLTDGGVAFLPDILYNGTNRREVLCLTNILISTAGDPALRYCEAITLAGGIPHPVYCPTPDLAEQYDGLLLTGGGDIHPDFFAVGDLGVSLGLDRERDRAELALTHAFLRAKKPILAICRGAQLLNVALGGSLYQEIAPALLPTHRAIRGRTAHPVITEPGSFLAELYGTSCRVNSLHHQGIARLGQGVLPCQWAEDGLVEGFSVASHPAWGVQWHPELLCSPKYRPAGVVDGNPLFRWWIAGGDNQYSMQRSSL